MVYTVWPTGAVGSAANEALVRESVADIISNLFPLETPLQQILPKMEMSNIFTEQPIDTFASASINRVNTVFGSDPATAANTSAKPEGHTYTDTTEQYPSKLTSVAEIQGESFTVSGTNRAMSMYGIADRFAYEAMKKARAVANQFELSMWWSPGTAAAGADLDSGVGTYFARQMQGLMHWILRSGLQRSKQGGTITDASSKDGPGNEFGTSNGTLNTGAATWAYDAAGVALDKSMFKTQLMNEWYDLTGIQAGAVGFCSGQIKNLFSEFALTANGAINERTLDAAAKRIVDTVDYYETDYGVIGLNLCRYLNIKGQSATIDLTTVADVTVPYNEALVLIQPQYWKIGVVRPVHLEALAKTLDGERGQVIGEMGLVCTNPQGGSGIVNCIP